MLKSIGFLLSAFIVLLQKLVAQGNPASLNSTVPAKVPSFDPKSFDELHPAISHYTKQILEDSKQKDKLRPKDVVLDFYNLYFDPQSKLPYRKFIFLVPTAEPNVSLFFGLVDVFNGTDFELTRYVRSQKVASVLTSLEITNSDYLFENLALEMELKRREAFDRKAKAEVKGKLGANSTEIITKSPSVMPEQQNQKANSTLSSINQTENTNSSKDGGPQSNNQSETNATEKKADGQENKASAISITLNNNSAENITNNTNSDQKNNSFSKAKEALAMNKTASVSDFNLTSESKETAFNSSTVVSKTEEGVVSSLQKIPSKMRSEKPAEILIQNVSQNQSNSLKNDSSITTFDDQIKKADPEKDSAKNLPLNANKINLQGQALKNDTKVNSTAPLEKVQSSSDSIPQAEDKREPLLKPESSKVLPNSTFVAQISENSAAKLQLNSFIDDSSSNNKTQETGSSKLTANESQKLSSSTTQNQKNQTESKLDKAIEKIEAEEQKIQKIEKTIIQNSAFSDSTISNSTAKNDSKQEATSSQTSSYDFESDAKFLASLFEKYGNKKSTPRSKPDLLPPNSLSSASKPDNFTSLKQTFELSAQNQTINATNPKTASDGSISQIFKANDTNKSVLAKSEAQPNSNGTVKNEIPQPQNLSAGSRTMPPIDPLADLLQSPAQNALPSQTLPDSNSASSRPNKINSELEKINLQLKKLIEKDSTELKPFSNTPTIFPAKNAPPKETSLLPVQAKIEQPTPIKAPLKEQQAQNAVPPKESPSAKKAESGPPNQSLEFSSVLTAGVVYSKANAKRPSQKSSLASQLGSAKNIQFLQEMAKANSRFAKNVSALLAKIEKDQIVVTVFADGALKSKVMAVNKGDREFAKMRILDFEKFVDQPKVKENSLLREAVANQNYSKLINSLEF